MAITPFKNWLQKNKVPVRKAVFINSAKLDWYILKPQVPNLRPIKLTGIGIRERSHDGIDQKGTGDLGRGEMHLINESLQSIQIVSFWILSVH
ncbi:hypothetical protein [Coleofasciculus sp. B1-GNL1-01]|uniref:hypothetical protein n=1 Tax=Coleofasciculus sp. B1-GNL1-01 TaxID=3068484 RepID=UPI004063FB3D